MPRFASRLCTGLCALVLSHASFADEADMGRGVSDEQLAQLGARWAAAMNERDVPGLNAVFDVEALSLRVAATVTDTEVERRDFARGFAAGAANLAPRLIAQIEASQGRSRYLRVLTYDGMRGALVRSDLGEGGFNYALLIAANRPGADPRVVDLFVATTGQRLSDSLGVLSQLLVSPSTSLLGRLFDMTTVDQRLVAVLTEIGELQRSAQLAEAFAKLDQLPDPIRNHRVILDMSVPLAGQLGEDIYREELARLARYHRDDPTAAFLLVDYFFLKGDTAAAMDAVLGLERTFGADAAIATMKANLAFESGDVESARRYAEQGADLEPDDELSRWTLLGILMPTGQYTDGIRVLEGLEADFGYAFDDTSFADNEVFAGFLESREYTAWLEERNEDRP